MHDNVECVYHEFAQWVVGEFLEDLPLPKEQAPVNYTLKCL